MSQKTQKQTAQQNNPILNEIQDEKPQNESKQKGDNDHSKTESSGVNLVVTKHPFKSRWSLLDDHSHESYLNQSIFRGFYNLAFIFGFFFLIWYPTLRYIRTGSVVNLQLASTFQNDFYLCILSWPLIFVWSYTALIHQKLLILKLMPEVLLDSLLWHIPQSVMFMYAHYIVINRNWNTIQIAYISFHSCVFFMQMHSYTVSNRDLRSQKHELMRNGVSEKEIQEQYGNTYPENISIQNFTLYMWMPTLVYEIEFPRNDRIRIQYVIRQIIYGIFSCVGAYILVTDYVIPVIEENLSLQVWEIVVRLIIPMAIIMILLFFIIFETTLNFFAEITSFADRQFYQDWWNSSSYEQYNRQWNRCVHEFLFRHVYVQSIVRYKKSRSFAQWSTFIFSALLHEWVFYLTFRCYTPIMMGFMLQQIPLFYLTKNMGQRAGNLLMWWGLLLGANLIATLYIKGTESTGIQFSQHSSSPLEL